ncbi:hypothetical protein ABZ897_62245, partial [Nonomuraea sp. NPDC046802]
FPRPRPECLAALRSDAGAPRTVTRGFAAADQFRKVRRLRADYIGPWLPEPLRTEESADGREERLGAALPTPGQ